MALRGLLYRISDVVRSSGKDGSAVFLALLFAVVVWLINSLSESYSTLMSVPVTLESPIEGHSPHASNTAMVVARCNASGFTILSHRFRRSSRVVSLPMDRADVHQRSDEEFYVSAAALSGQIGRLFGDGVILEAFVSDTLSFRFPLENYRRLPVNPVRVIRFRPQYMEMSPMRVDPDSVLVYGDPKLLRNLSGVYTKPIRLDDVHGGIHGVVSLELPSGLRADLSEVRYNLDAQRYVETSARLPIEVQDVPEGVSIRVYPSEAEVTFRCLFPLTYDPLKDLHLVIPYAAFAHSRDGKCVAHIAEEPEGLLSYRMQPEVFQCLEEDAL